MQEVQIANFLYLNGLDYEYERVYPFGSPSRNKKYTPDFYISQGEHGVWLEHYALSESGYNSLLHHSNGSAIFMRSAANAACIK